MWNECCLKSQCTCRIRFGSILVTASYGHYGQCTARIGPDPTSRILLSSVFPKRAWAILCKTDPVRVWPNSSGLKARRCACRNHRTRLRTGPQTRLRSSTDVQDNIIQNQPGPDLVLADCARFWPNGSGPEASQCTRIIRPASGQWFPADPARMRIGSGMFTGKFTNSFTIAKLQIPVR